MTLITRHPNILQIFGLSNHSGLYAAVTHEDMMPYLEFLAVHRPSPFMRVYLQACWRLDFDSVLAYDKTFLSKTWTSWIRRSSGRLCIELEDTDIVEPLTSVWQHDFPVDAPLVLNNPAFERQAVQMLTEVSYRAICFSELAEDQQLCSFTRAEARVGVLAFFPLGVQPNCCPDIVAHLPVLNESVNLHEPLSWMLYWDFNRLRRVNVSGWNRFNTSQLTEIANIHLGIWHKDYWLPQANHILRHLQVTSNHEKYVFVHNINFFLDFSKARGLDFPKGYLFVCPPDHLRTGPDSFAWPQCPWFWSMDPNGDYPLTEKDALSLGFPQIQMETRIRGLSWPSSVYEGLRTFHAAKGFDPDSEELAHQLGIPLLEVSGREAPLFSNVSDEAQIFIPECLDPVGKQARQFARAARVCELVEWKNANHQIAERNMDKKCRFEADKVAWHARCERGKTGRPREELEKPRWKDYRPEIRLRRPIKMLNGNESERRGAGDGEDDEEHRAGTGRRNRNRPRHRASPPY
ncbi:hypothetical protein FB45DRAFT_366286 [Roridomyces roridus]|uniref:Uncharacterized protein n=1 Tax=Roridomyces roridus TaxID=1738132 RepID=A0AAD7FX05_9AGAR|nr:hypothetical protein FB45DRAFT_366286 [Roridomyces roridus]